MLVHYCSRLSGSSLRDECREAGNTTTEALPPVATVSPKQPPNVSRLGTYLTLDSNSTNSWIETHMIRTGTEWVVMWLNSDHLMLFWTSCNVWGTFFTDIFSYEMLPAHSSARRLIKPSLAACVRVIYCPQSWSQQHVLKRYPKHSKNRRKIWQTFTAQSGKLNGLVQGLFTLFIFPTSLFRPGATASLTGLWCYLLFWAGVCSLNPVL